MVFSRTRISVASFLVVALAVTLPSSVPRVARAEAAERLKPAAERIDTDGGPVAAGRAWAQNRVRYSPAPTPKWPAATTATLDLKGAASRVAGSPVRVAGKDRVSVRLLDRATLPAQWRDRLVMSLTSASGAAAGKATVSVDYSAFRYAVGGGWASRLRLWQVPACALTTPDAPGCRSTALKSTNDVAAGVVTAAAPVAASEPVAGKGSYVVLAAAGPAPGATSRATSLAASGDLERRRHLRRLLLVVPAADAAGERSLARASRWPTRRSRWTGAPRSPTTSRPGSVRASTTRPATSSAATCRAAEDMANRRQQHDEDRRPVLGVGQRDDVA